jgi:hypothetical protein
MGDWPGASLLPIRPQTLMLLVGSNAIAVLYRLETIMPELQAKFRLFFISENFNLFCRCRHRNKGRDLLLHANRKTTVIPPNVAIKWLALLLPFREVPGSNFGLITSYLG